MAEIVFPTERRNTMSMASAAQSEQASSLMAPSSSRRKRTRDEMLAIFRGAREEVRAANPADRDLEAELIASRRTASSND